jgi:pSer/pThr/pTyr-binding forkhead associated (FHA) protein
VDLKTYSVAIGRGDGLVARTGDVVMYVADESGAAPLLKALESTADAQSPSRALAKALANVALGPDSGLIPSFGVLAAIADGVQLILRGRVAAEIEGDGASRTLTGDRAITWVDETVREPVDKIVIGRADISGLTASPHTNLRAGVVPGGGFVVHRVAAVKPVAPPPPPAAEIQPPTRAAPRPPEPAQRRPSPDRPVGTPPRKPAVPTAIARPGIGALATDDDAVYPLDRPYVIGRNPLIDQLVRDAQASPIFLPDDPQISRVHAYVTLDGGAVLVRDASTPGGTYVAAPGDQTWIRVGERPIELKPGWCVRIGQRILVYQKASSAQ